MDAQQHKLKINIMKLQIDTTSKTVRVEQCVKISDLIKTLKKLLPKEWDQYSLEAVTTIYNWYNPIPFTYTQPFEITYGETVTTVFNVEANN